MRALHLLATRTNRQAAERRTVPLLNGLRLLLLAFVLLWTGAAAGAAQSSPNDAFEEFLNHAKQTQAPDGQAGGDPSVSTDPAAENPATDLARGERILAFASAITVRRDGAIDVTETITVNVTGSGTIRHGIARDFPTRYRDATGREVVVGFSVLSVKRDGKPEPYAIENLSNGKRIRIGAKDVYLQPGRTAYEIRYTATRELGFFKDFDELYWNVTGNGWTMPIDAASVRITLPAGASVLRSSLYTGYSGSTGHDAAVEPSPPGVFAARTTRSLAASEGFTVAAAFPKGFVDPPGAAARAWYLFADNAPAIVAWLGVLLVGGYYFAAWSKVGRDPQAGVIVPLFRPPEGLTPAAARYIRRQGFDAKGFSSAIIGLAVKGYLKIAESGSTYSFIPLGKDPAPLTPGESGLLAALGSSPVEVKNTNHVRIAAARSRLQSALDNDYRGAAFVLNRGWFIGGAALSIAVLALTYALASEAVGGAAIAAVVLAVWWTGIVAFGRNRFAAFAAVRGFARLRVLFSLVFLAPFVLAGLAIPIGLLMTGTLSSDLLETVVGAAVLVVLNIVFFFLLTAPTPSGRALLDKIEGFRLYLATTEEDRLNVLNPPTRTPDLFERYLPYALALDCAHEWSEMFTGVLSAAGVEAPVWYSGSHWDPSRPTRFADRLDGSLTSSTSAAASPPGSSSGSSGGGSSGGGGGGGGGSGW